MITIVTGFGRSGTSLMCQMLAAGGFTPTPGAHYPMFEDPAFGPRLRRTSSAAVRSRILDNADGCFMKALGLNTLSRLLKGKQYQFIWTDRDLTQQARSWIKFRAWRGAENTQTEEELVRVLREKRPYCVNIMRQLSASRVPIVVRFEDLIKKPRWVAGLLAARLVGGEDLDTDKMVSQVVVRSTKVKQGMLEDELIAGRRAAVPVESDAASEELKDVSR